MSQSAFSLLCSFAIVSGVACQPASTTTETSRESTVASEPSIGDRKTVLRLRLAGSPTYEGTIEGSVRPDGSARITLIEPGWGNSYHQNRFLAIVDSASSADRRELVVWADAKKAPANGVLDVRLSPAKDLKTGDRIALFLATAEPVESPPATAAASPDVKVDKDEAATSPGLVTNIPIPEHTTLRRLPVPPLGQTQLNVYRIVTAFHRYHQKYKVLPPSVLNGPDGKPWHSWRVLLLPYLGEQKLYDEYKLTEPWDSPHNQKLLAKMPDVYRDPAFGEPSEEERSYTHYAVVTSESESFAAKFAPQCVFSTEGLQFKDPSAILPGEGAHRNLAIVRDGSGSSTLVGAVDLQAKIPWTKPHDLQFTAKFPGLGEPGGFAAPYELNGRQFGVLGFVDGTMHLIPRDIKNEFLHRMLTVTDSLPITDKLVPGFSNSTVRLKWWLTVETSSGAAVATLQCDSGEGMPQPTSAGNSSKN